MPGAEPGDEQPERALDEPGGEHHDAPDAHRDGGDQLARVPVRQRAQRDRPEQEEHAEGAADGAQDRVGHAEAVLDVGRQHRQGTVVDRRRPCGRSRRPRGWWHRRRERPAQRHRSSPTPGRRSSGRTTSSRTTCSGLPAGLLLDDGRREVAGSRPTRRLRHPQPSIRDRLARPVDELLVGRVVVGEEEVVAGVVLVRGDRAGRPGVQRHLAEPLDAADHRGLVHLGRIDAQPRPRCSVCMVMQFTDAKPKASEPGLVLLAAALGDDLVAGVRLVAEVVDLGEDRAHADGAVPLVLHRLEELRDGVGDLVAVGRPLRVEVEVHRRLHDGRTHEVRRRHEHEVDVGVLHLLDGRLVLVAVAVGLGAGERYVDGHLVPQVLQGGDQAGLDRGRELRRLVGRDDPDGGALERAGRRRGGCAQPSYWRSVDIDVSEPVLNRRPSASS